MKTDLFYKRCVSLYILMTGLMVGQSVLVSVLHSLCVFTVFLVLFFYRGTLLKRTFLLQNICYAIIAIIIGINFTKTFQAIIYIVFWIIVGMLPQFILKADSERFFWMMILCLGMLNTISLVLSKSEAIIIVFSLTVVSFIFALYSANIFFSSSTELQGRNPLKKGMIISVFLAIPGGMLVCLLIFFLFPRLHGISNSYIFGGGNRIGYSGEVSLTGTGTLARSNEVIMYISAKDSTWLKNNSQNILMRGKSLDRFNGVSWAKIPEKDQIYTAETKYRSNFQNSNMITVQMMSRGLSTLFYPGKFVGIWFLNHDLDEKYDKYSGDLALLKNTGSRFSYSVLFEDNGQAFMQDQLRNPIQSGWRRKQDLSPWLEVPDALRKSLWFDDLKKELAISEGDPIGHVMNKISRFYIGNFQVSLEMDQHGTNALESFLTQTKKGHCEYFATAASMLLRSVGIPSRMVVGYKGGDYNALIDLLEVRSDDAHAWVEVWHPEVGWISYDPTPAESVQESLGSYMMLYVNATDYLLKRYISGYDGQMQRDIIDSMRSISSVQGMNVKNLFNLLEKSAVPGVVIIALLLFYLLSIRYSKRRKKVEISPKFYVGFERFLSSRGLTRGFGETFRNFHNRLSRCGYNSFEMEQLTIFVEMYLYSNDFHSQELNQARSLIKKLMRQENKN